MGQTSFTHMGSVWAELVVRCLAYQKIHHIFLAPGSRSTPLVQALSTHDAFTIIPFFDERSLAFAALGYAKSTGTPACIITTSGTAVANLLPAVIEAHQSQTPLVILTADRPPELIGVGANQAIDQVSFLTDYVRSQKNLTPAEADIPAKVVASELFSAFHTAMGPVPGPVHINMMFREPLTEGEDKTDFSTYLEPVSDLSESCQMAQPSQPSQMDLEPLSEQLYQIKRGVILVGHLQKKSDRVAILALSEALNWPILPDVVSGLRLLDHPLVASHALSRLSELPEPEMVLLIGGHFTSRESNEWINQQRAPMVQLKPCDVVLNPWGIDQLLSIAHDLPSLVDSVTQIGRSSAQDNSFNQSCLNGSKPSASSTDTEQSVIAKITKSLPTECQLVLGNSLTIRHVDQVGVPSNSSCHTIVNRGASGIDGLVSTAIGAAITSDVPTVLILGDMSALHDIGAFKYLSKCPNLSVIIINNNGGRIFEKLAIGNTPLCEPYFVMPTNQSFAFLETAFECPYRTYTVNNHPIKILPGITELIV